MLFEYAGEIIRRGESEQAADLEYLELSRFEQPFCVANLQALVKIAEGHAEFALEISAEIIAVEAEIIRSELDRRGLMLHFLKECA